MFDQKPKSNNLDPLSVVPHWPQSCSFDDCEVDTSVALLQVRDNNGRIRSGAASDFCMPRKTDNPQAVLRNEYMFVRWVTRCSAHCCIDLRHTHNNQLRDVEEVKA